MTKGSTPPQLRILEIILNELKSGELQIQFCERKIEIWSTPGIKKNLVNIIVSICVWYIGWDFVCLFDLINFGNLNQIYFKDGQYFPPNLLLKNEFSGIFIVSLLCNSCA